MNKVFYKKILVTHDGSKLASSVLSYVASLALAYKAEVIMLRVINSVGQELAILTSSNIGMYPNVSNIALDRVIARKRRARYHLKKIKNELEAYDVKNVKTYVEEGLAQNVIIDIANTEHCDLIALSTHGRSGLGRALLGSVADYVIRYAACPVLVVHPNV